MGLSCGDKLAKYLLFIFNLVFWLAGILFLVVAIVVLAKADISTFQNFVSPNDNSLRSGAWVLLAVSIIIIVIGFAGCCGAIKESSCLLILYIIFLVITLCVETAIAIFVGVKKDQIFNQIGDGMTKVINNLYVTDNTTRNAVDSIQTSFGCCGVYNYTDWNTTSFITSPTTNPQRAKIVPDSCCFSNATTTTCQQNKLFYTTGCYQQALNWVGTYFPILIGVAAGIAAVQLIGILLACCLCTSLRNSGGGRV